MKTLVIIGLALAALWYFNKYDIPFIGASR